jgi:hypothetical protein
LADADVAAPAAVTGNSREMTLAARAAKTIGIASPRFESPGRPEVAIAMIDLLRQARSGEPAVVPSLSLVLLVVFPSLSVCTHELR